MAFLRGWLASISRWRGQPRRAQEFAMDGLRYVPDGPGAARLHLLYADAAAETGDSERARDAVTAAREAGERAEADELQDELGGQFRFTPAKQASLAGSALTGCPRASLMRSGSWVAPSVCSRPARRPTGPMGARPSPESTSPWRRSAVVTWTRSTLCPFSRCRPTSESTHCRSGCVRCGASLPSGVTTGRLM